MRCSWHLGVRPAEAIPLQDYKTRLVLSVRVFESLVTGPVGFLFFVKTSYLIVCSTRTLRAILRLSVGTKQWPSSKLEAIRD